MKFGAPLCLSLMIAVADLALEGSPVLAGDFPSVIKLKDIDGTNGFRMTAEKTDQISGPGGDVNSDGFDDIILSEPSWNTRCCEYAGAAFVVYGRASFPSLVKLERLDRGSGFRLVGATEGGFVGQSVAIGGDFNADGFADMLVGSPDVATMGTDSGAAYLVFGKSSLSAKKRAFRS